MIDQEKLQQAVTSLINAIGEDPERDGLVDTPRRISEMYAEFFAGIGQDPADVLKTVFDEDHQEIVILKDIPFYSICEHHFLPFFGHADIGYIPNGKVVGVSKLARALDILAHRPQLQERLTSHLVDAVYSTVKPQGVAAILTAEHMCVSIRGVNKPGSKVVTSASKGSFKTLVATKQEFLSLLRGS